MWTPDARVRRGPDRDVVEGVSGIPPERWGALCSVCGSSRGVVLRCSAGHCTLPFHALCGRNAGFHLAARGAPPGDGFSCDPVTYGCSLGLRRWAHSPRLASRALSGSNAEWCLAGWGA